MVAKINIDKENIRNRYLLLLVPNISQ